MSAPRVESTDERELKALIREIPDFPKPGILFYDITTLLKDARGLHHAALRPLRENDTPAPQRFRLHGLTAGGPDRQQA